ncbi:MAG: DNA-directed RNA polymerase subunit omega [Magnetococcales bacterium]|nr:DNA-directed RNA polymerase subunit omega [Magnetococcales bacterium]|tara:strand:+ start:10761 stop:11237 length:477 start_codon:yes stop_codon:yes gene_type:complete
MARVTVEDCVTIIPNRFELVLLASQRARDISAGVPLTVEKDNDKNPVVALREVAEQTIDFEELRRHIVHGVNRHADLNFEDDNITTLTEDALSDLTGSAESIQEVEFEGEEGEGEEAETVELSPEDAEDAAMDAAAAAALESLTSMEDSFADEEETKE